jgi:excisionase family DNA binding protein
MPADLNPALDEQIRRMTPVTAPPEQRADIAALHRALGSAERIAEQRHGCKLVGPTGQATAIPESVFYLLERVVEVLARGDSLTIVPVEREMTTQQAADLLNMSRQYLVRLLNERRLPFRKIGKHRRLRIDDVLAFKKQRDLARKIALDELTGLSEEMGGYDELK